MLGSGRAELLGTLAHNVLPDTHQANAAPAVISHVKPRYPRGYRLRRALFSVLQLGRSQHQSLCKSELSLIASHRDLTAPAICSEQQVDQINNSQGDVPMVLSLTSAVLGGQNVQAAQARAQGDSACTAHSCTNSSSTSTGGNYAPSIQSSSTRCSPAPSFNNLMLCNQNQAPDFGLGAKDCSSFPANAEDSCSGPPSCSQTRNTRGSKHHHATARQRQRLPRPAVGTMLGMRLWQAGRRVRRAWHTLAQALGPRLRPQGAGHNDNTLLERVVNVITCLPMVLSGRGIVRRTSLPATRNFGHLLHVMGMVAGIYHSCWGPRVKAVARKADYWAIAAGSCLLRSAMFQHSTSTAHQLATALSLLATPFGPSKVSSANFAVAEARYAVRALSRRELRRGWLRHLSLTASAGACFFLEDTPLLQGVPLSHALWHCLGNAAITSALGPNVFATPPTPVAAVLSHA